MRGGGRRGGGRSVVRVVTSRSRGEGETGQGGGCRARANTGLNVVFWREWWPIQVGAGGSFKGQWAKVERYAEVAAGGPWMPGEELWPFWSLRCRL